MQSHAIPRRVGHSVTHQLAPEANCSGLQAWSEVSRMRAPSTVQSRPTSPASPRPRQRWRLLIFPVLLFANFALFQLLTPGQPQRVEVSYTFFKQQVEADNVAQISTRADTIQGTFRQAATYQPDVAAAAKASPISRR